MSKVFRSVDIAQGLQYFNGEAQFFSSPYGICQNSFRAPWDPGKYILVFAFHSNEIVTAIRGRPKDKVFAEQGVKGLINMVCPQSGTISSDYDQSLGALLESGLTCQLHALPHVSTALFPETKASSKPILHLGYASTRKINYGFYLAYLPERHNL
jgi:hypothetical protein